MGHEKTNITASAIGYQEPDGGADQLCVLTLKPSGQTLQLSASSTSMDLANCGIGIHSDYNDGAMVVSGSDNTLDNVGPICVLGDFDDSGGSNSYDSSRIKEGCTPPPDPFANLTIPGDVHAKDDGCPELVIDNPGTVTSIAPGCYNKIIIKSDVTFQSGNYFVGEEFSISSTATVSSESGGVTFFMTEYEEGTGKYGKIDFSLSDGDIDLVAQRTGPHAGILFFYPYDPNHVDSGPVTPAGDNNEMGLDGVIYVPHGLVDFNGNNRYSGACGVKVVAWEFYIQGTTNIGPTSESCASNAANIPLGGPSGLVLSLVD